MTNVQFVLNDPKLLQKIASKVSDTVLEPIVIEALKEVQIPVEELLFEYLDETDTIKSLRGQTGGLSENLQAILGLTDLAASDGIASIKQAMRRSLNVVIKKRRGGSFTGSITGATQVDFEIKFDKINSNIEGLAEVLSYTSNDREIRWLDWLLNNSGTAPGYRLSFSLSEKGQLASRSGLALMKRARAGSTGWTSENHLIFDRNFIEEVLTNESFRQQVETLIIEHIGTISRRRKFRVE